MSEKGHKADVAEQTGSGQAENDTTQVTKDGNATNDITGNVPSTKQHVDPVTTQHLEEPIELKEPEDTGTAGPKVDENANTTGKSQSSSSQATAATMEVKPAWSSYWKKALSNVENTLDKVLQETSEVGPTTASTAQTPKTPPPQSPSPAPSTGRTSMQERLAKAVGSKRGSPASTPRQSEDQSRPTQKDLLTANEKEKKKGEDIEPPRNEAEPRQPEELPSDTLKKSVEQANSGYVEPPTVELTLTMAKNLFEVVKLLELEERDTIEKSFTELIKDLELQQNRCSEFSYQSLEKIDTLQNKLKYLSTQEAERAKAAKLGKSGLEKKVAEKDEQIALLFEEGQAMSKKELKHMTALKKARAQEQEARKQSENAIKQKEKAERELESTKEKLARQSETIKGLTKSGNETDTVRKERNQLKEKLDAVEQELADLQAKHDAGVLEKQTAALNEATTHVSKLEEELASVKMEFEASKETSTSEISDLHSKLEQERKNKAQVQADLNEEIKTLEAKVEYFRSKSEETAAGDGSGGSGQGEVNLLRQMEIMRTQHSIATENWHGIEANLQTKISQLETELEDAKTKESYIRKKFKSLSDTHRSTVDENERLNDRVQEVETQLSDMKQEIAKLRSQVDEISGAKTQAEEAYTREKQSLISEKERLQAELDANSKLFSETRDELQMAPSRGSSQLDLQDDNNNNNNNNNNGFGSPSLYDRRTPSDGFFGFSSREGDQPLETLPLGSASFGRNHSRSASIDPGDVPTSPLPQDGDDTASVTASASATAPSFQFLGKMNSTIRRLETELLTKSQELERVSRDKDEAYKQVAELLKDQEEYSTSEERIKALETQVVDLEKREKASLDLLGEKTEQVQELRADVEDIKSAYKQQIEELVTKLASENKL